MIHDFFSDQYVEMDNLQPADVTIVFGRADPTYVPTLVELYQRGLSGLLVISGGIGKDSGPLPQWSLTEAGFLVANLFANGVSPEALLLDTKATNGAENSRNSLQILVDHGLSPKRITLFGHPTSLVRLAAVHRKIAHVEFPQFDDVEYQLNACPWSSQINPDLLIEECKRLRDYPAKGWSVPVAIPDEILVLMNELGI